MNNSICKSTCPSGYQVVGDNCSALSSNDVTITAAHWRFNLFTSLYSDTISSKKAHLGSSTAWYPSYDVSDPKSVRWAGLSFDGDDIIYVTPYTGQTGSIVLNSDVTAEIVLRPKTNSATTKQHILYKGNADKDSAIFAFGNKNGNLFVEVHFQSILKDGTSDDFDYDLGTYPTSDVWTKIAIVLDLTGSQTAAETTISGYANGVLLNSHTQANVFFEDDPTNTFLLGGSWQASELVSSFVGHMWDVKISNTAFSAQNVDSSAAKVGSGTCGCSTCYNESSTVTHCLSECDLGEYQEVKGGSCLVCNNCPNGCISGDNCTPNDDPLCDDNLITGFDVTGCGGCMTGAVRDENVTNSLCACKANSTYDLSLDQCVCNENFKRATDGSEDCIGCKTFLKAGEFEDTVTFSEDYLYLILKFTKEIVTSNFTGCNFITQTTLDKLGLDPQCQWLLGNKEARVLLGSNATIIQGDTFTLDNDNVLTLGECHNDRIVLRSTVAYSSVKPTPTAVIIMPAEISLGCSQDLLVSAEASKGGLGRDFAIEWTFEFFATENGIVNSNKKISTADDTYAYPFAELSAGYARVSLKVTNFIGESSSYTESFMTFLNPDPALDVTFDVPTSYNVHRDEPIEIKATVENICPTNTTTATTSSYTYTWELDSQTGTNTTASFSSNGRRLEIAANVLEVGATYTYKCTANGGDLTGFSKLVINVQSQDLVLVVNRATSHVASENQIDVDASSSYDPDSIDNTGIEYFWTCVMGNNAACTNVAGANILESNASEAVINFPANTFAAGSAYTLTITVSKDTKSSSSSFTLTGVAGQGADLRLVDLPDRVQQHNPLRISMAETTNSVSSFTWNMKQGPATPQYSGPTNLSYLMIREDTLQAGQQYIFTLTASVNGVVTSADAKFEVNQGPEGGDVSVTPNSGIENETAFTMKAEGWHDGDELDYPLTYGWKYIDANGKRRDIQTNKLSKTLTRRLIGISDIVHNLQVICQIYDALDQYIDKQATVSITPNENRDQVSSEAIANLANTDVDDIPHVINTNGAVGANSEAEVNQLFDAYSRWNSDYSGQVKEGHIGTSVSMMVTLMEADGTDDRIQDIIKYTNEVAVLSKEIGGLYRKQGDDLLNALTAFTNDTSVIADTLDLIGEALLRSMLPGEDPYTRQDENSGTTHVYKRVNPSQLVANNSTSHQAETGQDV